MGRCQPQLPTVSKSAGMDQAIAFGSSQNQAENSACHRICLDASGLHTRRERTYFAIFILFRNSYRPLSRSVATFKNFPRIIDSREVQSISAKSVKHLVLSLKTNLFTLVKMLAQKLRRLIRD